MLRHSYDEGGGNRRAFTEIVIMDEFMQDNDSLSGEVGTVRGPAD